MQTHISECTLRAFSISPKVRDALHAANRLACIRWRDRSDETLWYGIGVAERFELVGDAQNWLRKYFLESVKPHPRVFGALPFNKNAWSTNREWILPKWQFAISGDDAIGYVVSHHDFEESELIDELAQWSDPASVVGERYQPHLIEMTPTFSMWKQQVLQIRSEIENNHLTKAVLSRNEEWSWRNLHGYESMFQRTCRANPHCYSYQIPVSEGVWIGASPECLLRIQNDQIVLDILAGTRRRGSTEREDAALVRDLYESEKDRSEHQIVLDRMRRELSTICMEVQHTEVAVKQFSSIMHLYSKLTGTLKLPYELDTLLQCLHPTPAVGGEPREAALTLLSTLEQHDRSRYAGPVGWVNAHESEFAVGIRSAMVSEDRATLYAGVGVVSGSRPGSEWYESTLKLQPMWSVLFGGSV